MARGGLVNSGGVCIAVTQAADALDAHYSKDAAGAWVAFVPDLFCNIGDAWNGSAWTYSTATPPPVSIAQIYAAFAYAGYAPALQTAVSSLTGTAYNAWANNITAADPTVVALASALGLTAQQGRSILQFAATLPT